MRKLILLLLLLPVFVSSQTDKKETSGVFDEVKLSLSMTNIGTIHHWSVPFNIDVKRPYLYVNLDLEGNITENFNVFVDIFSSYHNFYRKPFLNASTITIGGKVIFKRNEIISPFVGLKMGIAMVEEEMSSYYTTLNTPVPIVMGIRTGIVARVHKRISIGFTFDNTGLFYKYTDLYTSRVDCWDATRLSFFTSDLIWHIRDKN